MAEASTQPAPATPAAKPAPRAKIRSNIDWSAVWPVPLLALSLVLLAGGVAMAVVRAPRTDPAAPLKFAKEEMEEGKFRDALETLNDKLVPVMNKGLLAPDQEREFYLLRAQALFLGQQQAGINQDDNNREVIKAYRQVEKMGGVLEPADTGRLATAFTALGDTEQALELIRLFPPSEAPRRLQLTERIIERNLTAKDVRYEQTLQLLSELLEMPDLPVERKAWATARQAELRLAMNYSQEAIARLLRALPRFENLHGEPKAELLYLLGKGYFQVNEFTLAAQHLEAAERDLSPQSEMLGETGVMLARILMSENKPEEALERFATIAANYPDAKACLPALIGAAGASAIREDHEGAAKYFQQAIEAASKGPMRRDVTLESIAAGLLELWADRYQRGDHAHALRYAKLAESAQKKEGEVQPEALIALAQSHRALAALTLAEAAEPGAAAPTMQSVSPVTASEAKRHLLDAGQYFTEHHHAVMVRNYAMASSSLWNAAECYDEASDWKAAADALSSYLGGAKQDDPRVPEARYRLAQVYRAQGEMVTAASLFNQIIKSRARTLGVNEGAQPTGVWADRSYVPLAQCLLSDKDPANDAQALELLEQVVSGSLVAPQAGEYREALTELGEASYAKGDYAVAISRLDEALRRYPDHPHKRTVVFKLADANRLSAQEIARELRTPLPLARRAELEEARTRRLRTAGEKYQELLDLNAAADQRRLTELDRLYARNAMFYLGDVAFDVRDYTGAIAAYDAARQRYASDPAALVALTQIVSAYVKQENWKAAETANERARQQLRTLPDDIWDNKRLMLPMAKEHWERWLEAKTVLEQRTQRAGAAHE